MVDVFQLAPPTPPPPHPSNKSAKKNRNIILPVSYFSIHRLIC